MGIVGKDRSILYFFVFISILVIVNCAKVPKCCPQGFALDKTCIKSNDSQVNPFISSNGQDVEIRTVKCAKGSLALNSDYDAYYLFDNSSLYVNDTKKLLQPSEYCIDLIIDEGKICPLICFDDNDENQPPDVDLGTMRVYSIGMLLSLPFLIATFLVYVLVKELRTFHGRCLSCHVFALIMSYSVLAFLMRFTHILNQTTCTVFGYSVQYFFLATFFWLNIMCIDIYLAFSSVRLRGSRGGDIRKLVFYSLYAWGMPLIILLITVTVDFSDLVPDNSPFKPKIGIQKCFFDDRSSAYMYFYGPMGVLICTNLILFAITAYRIWRTSKETAALNRGDSRRHSDKQENERFKLYVKLFLVMGINWVAELISFILGKQVPQYFWYLTDLTNTLQGVFIFIIFVWKRKVRRLIWDRVCMMTGRSTRISRSSRGGTSSDATDATSINNTAVSQLRLKPIGLVK